MQWDERKFGCGSCKNKFEKKNNNVQKMAYYFSKLNFVKVYV